MSLSEWGMDDSDVNPVDAALELMQEKRGSTRERGLAALVTQLASVYSYDYLYDRRASSVLPGVHPAGSIKGF